MVICRACSSANRFDTEEGPIELECWTMSPTDAAVAFMNFFRDDNSGTSAAFLRQLRDRHSSPLMVIWDNAPAHRGEAVREYLRTPGLPWGW